MKNAIKEWIDHFILLNSLILIVVCTVAVWVTIGYFIVEAVT